MEKNLDKAISVMAWSGVLGVLVIGFLLGFYFQLLF